MKQQVLEVRKAILYKQFQTLIAANLIVSTTANQILLTVVDQALPIKTPAANLGEAKNLNFGLYYEHKGEKSHLISFMRKY